MMTTCYSDVKGSLSRLMNIEMDQTVVTFIDELATVELLCADQSDLQKICNILDSHPGEFIISRNSGGWHPNIVCKPDSACYIHLKMAL